MPWWEDPAQGAVMMMVNDPMLRLDLEEHIRIRVGRTEMYRERLKNAETTEQTVRPVGLYDAYIDAVKTIIEQNGLLEIFAEYLRVTNPSSVGPSSSVDPGPSLPQQATPNAEKTADTREGEGYSAEEMWREIRLLKVALTRTTKRLDAHIAVTAPNAQRRLAPSERSRLSKLRREIEEAKLARGGATAICGSE